MRCALGPRAVGRESQGEGGSDRVAVPLDLAPAWGSLCTSMSTNLGATEETYHVVETLR